MTALGGHRRIEIVYFVNSLPVEYVIRGNSHVHRLGSALHYMCANLCFSSRDFPVALLPFAQYMHLYAA